MSVSEKAQIAVLLALALRVMATLASPVTQNYSSEILRMAKTAQIKAYMNTDKDYCDNFYKYACGKWKRLQGASVKDPKTSYLEQLQDLYVRKSAEMMKANHDHDNNVDVLLKEFFESCYNEDEVTPYSLEPVLRAMDFRGGWPKVLSPSWYSYEYDWLKTIAELRRKLGVDILVGLEIVPDFEDKDMHRIKVGAPKLALGSKKAYLSDDFKDERKAYKEDIEKKLRKHFPEMGEDWAEEISEQVLDLEKQLAQGLPDNPKLTLEQTSRQRYASELKAAYGSLVDLNRYLNIIFNQTIYVQVYETPEDYMSNLVDVLKQTSKQTLANYTMWRVLDRLDFAGEVNARHNAIWCVRKIGDFFPQQLENMFHRNYNNMQLINELQSVWADIKSIFKDELLSTRLNWISQPTRQKAVLKLDNIRLKLITHDDDDGYNEQMQGLVFKPDKYYSNLINALEWKSQHQLAQLIEKPQPPAEDTKLPQFKHATNNIEIPATFLQARFFWDVEYPHALKYSTLGFLLAHEMLHAFDAAGRRYDQYGHQKAWWDSISEYSYDERATCFAKNHYSGFVFRGKDVSGTEPREESIVDSGGLAIAYRAYQKWWENLADNEEILQKESLHSLESTPKQLFFIGFAQLWCADYHKSVESFTEVPEPLRVNNALANLNDFAREMQCEMGSKMNPAKKCVIF